ncbi:diphthamide biosynthesis enzyme Dph2 [Methanobacterium petrolearium]|uniref:diphthamide biosynthesis enzyme Dph2 n=1 Tax=Methanobacterium petrolearium TaxID=710190 RepID=UPI001AE1FC46|nr:diphthamide biosynthesis enzyme Dph2 [Methanobacterium petrolearium]MBP1944708.1 2-(3-amino-3-carboxypropyl)histidine synthase [Methanobacterium petrolearium]BDZ69973.1 diphthamide biosynthesis enzyme Dph2 [Methanobacterium petrolearium]
MTNYQFKLDAIINKIKDIGAENIGLQFPEGLKIHATQLASEIETKTGATVLISGDPCWGACDLSDREMEGLVDLLVHFGHTPLPIEYKVPTLFIEASYQLESMQILNESLMFLEGKEKIGLVTTTQHLHLLDDAANFLEENGKQVIMKEGSGTRKGQVLGCNFSSVQNLPVDAFLYLGSGNFHPLGIKLSTQKPVIIADPYLNQVRNIDEFADRILRIRFARITRAKEAQKFGILLSSKVGQSRWELAKSLKKMIHKGGKEAYLILLDEINPPSLMPFMDLDAFIVTACPRIAIDDSEMYEKPLLTPHELEIVLGVREWEDYKMDEIKY